MKAPCLPYRLYCSIIASLGGKCLKIAFLYQVFCATALLELQCTILVSITFHQHALARPLSVSPICASFPAPYLPRVTLLSLPCTSRWRLRTPKVCFTCQKRPGRLHSPKTLWMLSWALSGTSMKKRQRLFLGCLSRSVSLSFTSGPHAHSFCNLQTFITTVVHLWPSLLFCTTSYLNNPQSVAFLILRCFAVPAFCSID